MLPRSERLSKTGLFQRVYSGKKSVHTPLVSLYVLERQPRSAPRLPLVGFVIGKKIHAKATERNRTKRRVREAYRLFRQNMLLTDEPQPGDVRQWYSLVWLIRAEALEASFEAVKDCVSECLTKATQKYGRKGAPSNQK